MPETKTDRLSEALTTTLSSLKDFEIATRSADELSISATGISFYIMRLARAIIVRGDTEFFIGRIGQENSTELMVDLEDFGGFMMGVSRRHAVIRPAKDGYEITDLSSRNGTWLDGLRLFPNKAYPMVSGEKLRIGREQLLVRYRST